MEIEEYKQNPEVNANYKPSLEKAEHNPDELTTTDQFIHHKSKNKSLLDILKKISKDFLCAYAFKVFFKVARNLDKSMTSSLSYEKLIEIILDPANAKYASFVVVMKMLFSVFRKILYIINLHSVLEYKRLNFLFGLLSNFILIPIGKKSTIIFYTCVFYLLKNAFYFLRQHLYSSEQRLYKESKQLYFIGASLGFILVTLFNKDLRNSIKLFKIIL